ncbi:DUF2514 family protein [Achromobacter spanius]|uniref:DUF2514 family protein n=1 Tax=Achromobacter spanius TaxID=217203 RepID=UPI000F9576A9
MAAEAKLVGWLVGWRGYAAAALAGALVIGSAAWIAQGWRGDAKLARTETAHAMEREAQAQASMTAIEAAREEGRRRTAAAEDARNEAQRIAAAAVADAAGARADSAGLLARANALVVAAASRDPAAADGGPTGADAVDLLAYMLGRVSDRAAELAGIADRARIAGLTCERIYDALRK